MELRRALTAIAVLLLPLIAQSAPDIAPEAKPGIAPQQEQVLAAGDPARDRRQGFRASELLGTPVHDDWGRSIGEVEDIIIDRWGAIETLVADVGGFLAFGERRIAVPWRDVNRAPSMRWVQVPIQLHSTESEMYSLGGPDAGRDALTTTMNAWRLSELLGDHASVAGETHRSLVTDVIFAADGRVRLVVLARERHYVGPGWQRVRPYSGYRRGRYAYELRDAPLFDYVPLGNLRRFASEPDSVLNANRAR
jgi:sporulation protein YlmC with PRC-barrel domain